MKPFYIAMFFLTAVVALSACNVPAPLPTQDSNALSTSVAQTAQSILSPTETIARVPIATQTVHIPTITTTDCDDNAASIAWTRNSVLYDVNEVEKRLAPNSAFTMQWTLQNMGTCTWDSTYQMYLESGTPLTPSTTFPILKNGEVVTPGGTVAVEIEMTAPAQAGDYQSTYSLQNSLGEAIISFGVVTKVGDASKLLSKPGGLGYTYDCTTGSVNISLYWVDKATGEDGYRIYRDGTKIAELASDATSYNDTAPSAGAYRYTIAAFNSNEESSAGVSVDTSNCK